MPPGPDAHSAPSSPNMALLAAGTVLVAVLPFVIGLIARQLDYAGLPFWLAIVPWFALVIGIGWGARTGWWIVAAALAPLPLLIPAIGLYVWMFHASLDYGLVISFGVLIVAVVNALLAALGTWLGLR